MRISLWTRLLDFISPRPCAVCGARLAVTEEEVCSVCNLHFPRTDFHLHPIDNKLAKLFWGLVPIERAAALFYYEPHSVTSHLVYMLKYFGHIEVGTVMGRMMGRELGESGFFDDIDIIVPVPLSKKRQRERGYNQSEELAKGIGLTTGIAVETHGVRRTTFRRSQTQLSDWERRENVAGLFCIGKRGDTLAGKHVLLVDDVVTTGATLVACANALKELEGIRFSVLALGYTKY